MLADTVEDLWHSNMYALAILIAVFSGAWPFVKLVLMLISILAPPEIMSPRLRGFILKFVDAVGKWSLIDVFVMLLFVSAFYCEVYFGSSITVYVVMELTWSFYAFLAATTISLIIGNVLTHLHSHIMSCEKKKNTETDTTVDDAGRESLLKDSTSTTRDEHSEEFFEDVVLFETFSGSSCRTASYSRSSGGDEDNDTVLPLYQSEHIITITSNEASTPLVFTVKLTWFGAVLLLCVLSAVIITIIWGSHVLSMQFTFKGLVGALLRDEASQKYSVMTIGTLLVPHSGKYVK